MRIILRLGSSHIKAKGLYNLANHTGVMNLSTARQALSAIIFPACQHSR